MKRFALIVVLLFAALPDVAHSQSQQPARPVPVVHHQVSAVVAAQAAFDQGLLDYYAYNPEAAEHQFYIAADLDPTAAMAYWGIALSNAPNLNVPANDDRDDRARDAIKRAEILESNATPEDRLLIDAAAARFAAPAKSDPGVLESAYRDALGSISRLYPSDPDVAALHLEAALYAVVDQAPAFSHMSYEQRAPYRQKFAALLPLFAAALQAFPQHIGLLHFYIHAAEIADDSQVALEAARRLAAFGLASQDSHLTHMPGHIFLDLGLYEEALDVGARSVAMDAAQIDCCHPGYYSAVRYYHNHNVSFLLYAMTELGKTAAAVAVAQREHNDDFIARQLIADGRWQAVLALRSGPHDDATLIFARAIAFAKLGSADDVRRERDRLPRPDSTEPERVALDAAMRSMLQAELALLAHDDASALRELTQASQTAAVLNHAEIPGLYYYSPHMELAVLATRLGRSDVAKAALQAELAASPGSKRALAALARLAPAM